MYSGRILNFFIFSYKSTFKCVQMHILFELALVYLFFFHWAQLRIEYRAALHITLATMHLHYNLAHLTPIEPYPDHLTVLTRLRLVA